MTEVFAEREIWKGVLLRDENFRSVCGGGMCAERYIIKLYIYMLLTSIHGVTMFVGNGHVGIAQQCHTMSN